MERKTGQSEDFSQFHSAKLARLLMANSEDLGWTRGEAASLGQGDPRCKNWIALYFQTSTKIISLRYRSLHHSLSRNLHNCFEKKTSKAGEFNESYEPAKWPWYKKHATEATWGNKNRKKRLIDSIYWPINDGHKLFMDRYNFNRIQKIYIHWHFYRHIQDFVNIIRARKIKIVIIISLYVAPYFKNVFKKWEAKKPKQKSG